MLILYTTMSKNSSLKLKSGFNCIGLAGLDELHSVYLKWETMSGAVSNLSS